MLLILHDGQFAHSRHAKIARRVTLSHALALVPSGKSDALIRASCPTEGAHARSPRTLGQDAVDAWVSRGERRTCVRRSRVVLIPRRWDQVGGSIRQRRWLTSPDTGESAIISRRPIVQGMSECSGEPVVANSCAFLLSHARLWVRRAPGIPCALCFQRVTAKAKLGQIMSRECRAVSSKLGLLSRGSRCYRAA